MKKILLLVPLFMLCFAAQSVAQNNVTLSVDMQEYTGTYTTVYVNGGFNGWDGTSNPMDDTDGDGVWTTTLSLPAGSVEYKFTVDGWTDQENFLGGEDCTLTTGNYTNRVLDVQGDVDMGVVCWNSCAACGATGGPADGDVTFQVDMSEYTGTFTSVNLNGNFNGWCGGCNEMTDADMDGVYEITLNVPGGNIEYKFTVDAWNDQEQFLGGEDCTLTTGNYTNRVYAVDGNATLDVVCWNSCNACGFTGGPADGDITFQVDMSQYMGTFTTVNLNGNFNGWCGGCNEMTDGDGDGVYEVTLNVPGGNIEYKFTVDGWTDQENFAGGEECTLTTGEFTNRVYAVDGNATLDVVCWNSCEACAPMCSAPENIQHQLLPPSALRINWNDHPNATRYDVIYRPLNSTGWMRRGVYNSEVTLRYLQPNTVYVYRVRSYCGSWNFENASDFIYFNTGNMPEQRMAGSNVEAAGSVDMLDVYPNPATDNMTVEFNVDQRSDVQLTVVDLMGRTISNQVISNAEGHMIETMDVSNMNQGYYMLIMQSGDERIVKKFAKVN